MNSFYGNHKKNVLMVAFSTLAQFPVSQLKGVGIEEKDITICSPYDYVYLSWKPHVIFKRLIKNLIRKYLNILKEHKNNFNYSNLSAIWSSSVILQKYLNDNLEIDAMVAKPGQLYFIFKFPQAFFWAWKHKNLLAANFLGARKNIFLEGIESTGYILDSLMRYSDKFRIQNETSSDNMIAAIYLLAKFKIYCQWFKNFSLQNKIDEVIVNHNVYMESGWIAAYMSEVHQATIIHTQQIQIDALELVTPRDIYLREFIRLREAEAIIPPARLKSLGSNKLPWYSKESIADLTIKNSIEIDSKKYLIAMHAFHDANNIHNFPGLNALFPSYYHWIKKSIEIAKNNPELTYIFRIHPATFQYYHKDLDVLKTLFSASTLNIHNIYLEDPRKANSFNLDMPLPIVITFQGSIALECALIGLKTITVGYPVAPISSYIRAETMADYVSLLSQRQDIDKFRMNEKEIIEAQIWKQKLIDNLAL